MKDSRDVMLVTPEDAEVWISEYARTYNDDTPAPPPARDPRRVRLVGYARLVAATVLHGIGTGLIGVFIAVLIRQVQEAGYGHEHGGFLEIATRAPPWRRTVAVVAAGFFGATAWYWLRGREVLIVSVSESLKGAKMPPMVTILNAIIQDVVVALGGSFGREAAPREIAAMWGGLLGDKFNLPKEERRLLVACGTGAALAAVYSVPVSGTLYTLEHVLNWELSWVSVLLAVSTAWLATVVGGLVVEDSGLYAMPKYSYNWPSFQLLLWAVLSGPVAGASALLFRWLVKSLESFKPPPRQAVAFADVKAGDQVYFCEARDGYQTRGLATIHDKGEGIVTLSFNDSPDSKKDLDEHEFDNLHFEGPRDRKILVVMPLAFFVLGLLAAKFPSLLGNGRALAEFAIRREGTILVFVFLLLLKAILTACAIGSGAAGGTLTPSVALGATLGAIFGGTWQSLNPDFAPKDDAHMSVITAAAFLAIMLRSPVTALWLMMEFSAQGLSRHDLGALLQGDLSAIVRSKLLVGMWLPMAIAIAGAIGATHMCDWVVTKIVQRRGQGKQPPQVDADDETMGPEIDSKSEPVMLAAEQPTPEQEMHFRSSLAKCGERRSSQRSNAWTHDLDLGDTVDEDVDGYMSVSFIRSSTTWFPMEEDRADFVATMSLRTFLRPCRHDLEAASESSAQRSHT